MARRDPIVYGIALLGFGGAYCRGWLPRLLPGYTEWVWWRQLVLRVVLLGLSALLAWLVIRWRVSLGTHALESGPYWAMWGIGVIAGLVTDEVHGFVDGMFP